MGATRLLDTESAEKTGMQPWALAGTGWNWETNSERLTRLADRFSPITLDEMSSVALLNRVDTKYVLSTGQLLRALVPLQKHYRVLCISGKRLNHYRSLYFDTPDFLLYNMHVNGRANRYKVRSREYTDTNLSFLEVKHKTNKDRTIKERLQTDSLVLQINRYSERWLSDVFPFDSRSLEGKIWNTFTRLTLVSIQNCERVTLDINLTFYKDDSVIHLDDAAIAEVKMDAGTHGSAFMEQMHRFRIQPHGFSKYCVGVAMLYDQVKKNAIKPKMLLLKKINEGMKHD